MPRQLRPESRPTETVVPTEWVVNAMNLVEHARNPIHTDDGARAAGFPRALIAGVTTYAYLTHPIVAAWGEPWLTSGGGEVRFRSPVFLHDQVHCVPQTCGEEVVVSTVVDGDERATLRAVVDSGPAPAMRDGERLRPRQVVLEGEFGDEYGMRAGDDLALYSNLGVVHPAVWPALANRVVHADVASGSWVHTRSVIRHHALVPVGATVDVFSIVVDRFDRPTGERAILDVRIELDGVAVATLEHEAIVALPRR